MSLPNQITAALEPLSAAQAAARTKSPSNIWIPRADCALSIGAQLVAALSSPEGINATLRSGIRGFADQIGSPLSAVLDQLRAWVGLGDASLADEALVTEFIIIVGLIRYRLRSAAGDAADAAKASLDDLSDTVQSGVQAALDAERRAMWMFWASAAALAYAMVA